MTEYLVVIEQEDDSWGAFCPDLPGVGVVADTREEVERLIHEAVAFHLEGLRESGDPIPKPSAVGTTLVQVPAAQTKNNSGIYRGEVRAIMLALTHLSTKLQTILAYIEGDDDVDEEETESPDA